MKEETLEAIGLTRGEANVYLTLIKLGLTSSGAIINRSNVSRSKVYDVLERLKQKGLITEVIKENTRHFEATSPDRILNYLEEKRKELDVKISESKRLVSDLKKVQNTYLEKQEARVYTGVAGLKTIYNEILEDLDRGEEYLAFGIGKEEIADEEIKAFIKKFHIRRAEKSIFARILMQESARKDMEEFSKLKNYNYKLTKIEFPTNIAIWKDKVLTLVWGDLPMGFLIQSKQISAKYRKYFDSIWNSIK